MVLNRKIKVGDEVESKCTKCKKITFHTVESMDGDNILKVICKVCGSKHKYRPPKKEKEKKKTLSEKRILKKAKENEEKWLELISDISEEDAKPYLISGSYEVGDLIEHPKFGKGYVSEIVGNKMVVTFKDGDRKLIFNTEKK